MNYEQIKATAKALRCRVDDLITLDRNNDPFYCGVAAREQGAQWFANLWQRHQWGNGVHLRRLHYVLVSSTAPILKPNGKPYLNTDSDWKFLGTASLAARYLNAIPTRALVDRRNPEPMVFAANEIVAGGPVRVWSPSQMPAFGFSLPVPDSDLPRPWLYVSRVPDGQPYLVELWIEKTTMNDVLLPIARRLGVNVVAGAGETSEILARQAIERAIDADRPMRILYISDFDPGGRSMPVALARKLEYILHDSSLDLDITLQPIALTPEQCEHYRLPRTPLKETERRAAHFEERFGEGATELDALEALHPGELARLVEHEVCRYIDPTLESRCKAAMWEIQRHLDRVAAEICEPHAEAVNDIQTRYQQIVDGVKAAVDAATTRLADLEEDAAPLWKAIASDLNEAIPEIELETPTARDAFLVDEPLFDSSRGYLEQLDHYRAWQGRD